MPKSLSAVFAGNGMVGGLAVVAFVGAGEATFFLQDPQKEPSNLGYPVPYSDYGSDEMWSGVHVDAHVLAARLAAVLRRLSKTSVSKGKASSRTPREGAPARPPRDMGALGLLTRSPGQVPGVRGVLKSISAVATGNRRGRGLADLIGAGEDTAFRQG